MVSNKLPLVLMIYNRVNNDNNKDEWIHYRGYMKIISLPLRVIVMILVTSLLRMIRGVLQKEHNCYLIIIIM